MLNQYINHLDGLIAQLSVPKKRALLRVIGQEMRRRNAQRISANVTPDGYPFAARRGDKWKTRALRPGESLQAGQKFNYFKQTDLQLRNVIDRGDRLVGRLAEGHNDGYRAAGFLKKWIRIKKIQAKTSMFQKMPRSQWLRFKYSSDQAQVGFWGLVGAIASEHQSGVRAKQLAMRELIGFSSADLDYLHDAVIKHLANHH